MSKNIYDLDFHEETTINPGLNVVRVPGGWIYEHYDDEGVVRATAFVPWDNEFQGKGVDYE